MWRHMESSSQTLLGFGIIEAENKEHSRQHYNYIQYDFGGI